MRAQVAAAVVAAAIAPKAREAAVILAATAAIEIKAPEIVLKRRGRRRGAVGLRLLLQGRRRREAPGAREVLRVLRVLG